MWRWTVSPEAAPDEPQVVEIEFARGDPVALDGERLSPASLLARLNELGGAHGVGRQDLVENRYVGMKSRGCYETPGGAILLKAHRAIESLTLDREVAHLKDELMPRYARLVYNGYWWSPERKALQALIDESQEPVNGHVRLKLYKGGVSVLGRRSPDSLFDESMATFEDDRGAYSPQRRHRLHPPQRPAPAPGRQAGPYVVGFRGIRSEPPGLLYCRLRHDVPRGSKRRTAHDGSRNRRGRARRQHSAYGRASALRTSGLTCMRP